MKYSLSVRVDFVCSVAADHVHNGLVSTWMIPEKSIHLEDLAINDNDRPAICDHALDLPSSKDNIFLSHPSEETVCQSHTEGLFKSYTF